MGHNGSILLLGAATVLVLVLARVIQAVRQNRFRQELIENYREEVQEEQR